MQEFVLLALLFLRRAPATCSSEAGGVQVALLPDTSSKGGEHIDGSAWLPFSCFSPSNEASRLLNKLSPSSADAADAVEADEQGLEVDREGGGVKTSQQSLEYIPGFKYFMTSSSFELGRASSIFSYTIDICNIYIYISIWFEFIKMKKKKREKKKTK